VSYLGVKGYAYFGMYTTPGIVVKIRCYANGSPPVRVGALTIPDGQGISLHRSVIDRSFTIGYFATFDDPGQVSTSATTSLSLCYDHALFFFAQRYLIRPSPFLLSPVSINRTDKRTSPIPFL